MKYSPPLTRIPGNHRDTKPANQPSWELEPWPLIGHVCPLSSLLYQRVLHCVVWLLSGQRRASALPHKQHFIGGETDRKWITDNQKIRIKKYLSCRDERRNPSNDNNTHKNTDLEKALISIYPYAKHSSSNVYLTCKYLYNVRVHKH